MFTINNIHIAYFNEQVLAIWIISFTGTNADT